MPTYDVTSDIRATITVHHQVEANSAEKAEEKASPLTNEWVDQHEEILVPNPNKCTVCLSSLDAEAAIITATLRSSYDRLPMA